MTAGLWLLLALVLRAFATGGAAGTALMLFVVFAAALRWAYRKDMPAGYAGMLPRYVR